MRTVSAVIFDMDGVIVNSEPLWRRAMITGFGEFGIHLTEDDCRETMGRRFSDVVRLWVERRKIEVPEKTLERRVEDLLVDLIQSEGKAIPGVMDIMEICRSKRIPAGLATSSSERLMKVVASQLSLHDYLQVMVSAEKMRYAKPHPEVFLVCAEQLGVDPHACLVIEDSLNGVIAGKAARMQVLAVPDEGFRALEQFAIADFRAESMTQAANLAGEILNGNN